MNDLTRHAPSLPGLEASHETRAILDRFQIEMENLLPVVNRFPSKEERAALQQRNYDLRRLLRPAQDAVADMETARRMISMMLNNYPSIRNKAFTSDADRRAYFDEQINSYLLHLQELPVFAITRACEDVTKNRISGLDPDWPPTTPRMVKAVRDKIEQLSAEQWKVDAVLTANKTMRAEVSPEAAARVTQKFKELRASLPTFKDVFTEEERQAVVRRDLERQYREIERNYRAIGMEPPANPKFAVSPELARKINPGGDVDKAFRKRAAVRRRK